MLKRLGSLRARYPEIVVEFLTANQFFDLARREADLAVRVAPALTGDLVARKLADCGWALYASASYLERASVAGTSEADGLSGHEVIAYDQEHAFYPGAQWLEANARGATIVMRGNTIISVLNAATVGMGIATLPCFLGDAEPMLRRTQPAVIASRPMWLVVHPDLVRVARVRAAMDWVIEIMTADARLLSGERGQ
jgi:DNA-binding transcriptional LysR family regulator